RPRSARPSLFGRLRQVLTEAAPDLDVDQLVAVAHLPAEHSLLLPAVVDDGLLRRLVGGRDPAVDLVRSELLEGLQVGEALGLPPDPLAADPLVAHDRPELRRRLAVEPVEGREADRIVDALDHHRPLAVLGLRVTGLFDRTTDPALGVILGELPVAVLQ